MIISPMPKDCIKIQYTAYFLLISQRHFQQFLAGCNFSDMVVTASKITPNITTYISTYAQSTLLSLTHPHALCSELQAEAASESCCKSGGQKKNNFIESSSNSSNCLDENKERF